MTLLKAIWHDLIEKKLWLVALPLAVMIVAAPFALGSAGEPPATEVPPPVVAQDDGPSLDLTATAMTGFARAPRVSTKALDPFGARSKPSLDKLAKEIEKAVDDILKSGGGGATPPSDPDPDTGGGNPPETDAPKVPKPKYESDDLLSILYSEDDAEPIAVEDMRTLSPLPDPEPFLVYVGKTANGGASFLVSAEVKVSGQGTCAPSKADCRTLELAIGETAQFELLTRKNAADTTKNVIAELTITDIVREKVLVVEDAEDTDAAALEGASRAQGAMALKSVLSDQSVLAALKEQRITIRR